MKFHIARRVEHDVLGVSGASLRVDTAEVAK